MKGLNNFLIKRFVVNYNKIEDQQVRSKYGFLEAWVSIIGNTVLFIIKLLIGIFTNSIALLADAFHTLSDVITSACVLIGFSIARKPPDKEHPFGHGRSEYIATLIIAILLITVGFEFFIHSIERIINPPLIVGNWWLIILMVSVGIFKEWMARFSINLGKIIRSDTLLADAWHHRSDAIATFLIALSFLGAMFGIYRLDGILGALVSMLIIYTGLRLSRKPISNLMGQGAGPELKSRIIEIASKIPGVKDVHEIDLHEYGSIKIVSIHIEVEPNLHVSRSHDISEKVQEAIDRELGTKTTVHVEPYISQRKSKDKKISG
ncbi:MAG: cation diffusion facilitator family transporter [candidate division WOR-3 bacterium]